MNTDSLASERCSGGGGGSSGGDSFWYRCLSCLNGRCVPESVLQDARFACRGEGAVVVEFRRTLTTSGEVCRPGCRALRKAVGKINHGVKKENKVYAKKGDDLLSVCVHVAMRRASFDKHVNAKRNVLSNTSYGLTKDAEYKCSVKYSGSLQEKNYLQRSVSADNVVIHSRGYKPSDRHDPIKRNFLENLTSKILHFDMEGGRETTPINLQKLFTPASDSQELQLQTKNKKMFASSYFYAPTHPTVEDQVELARRISHSLSDIKNVKSKGQSMYVNRKKRSVKWIHDGNGIEDEEESTMIHKEKLPLKCVMNPCGKVLDIHGIQALGEEVNIASVPKNPEKLFDIVRDLNNQKGRGAEIFAKRRKRSEKWVVDQEQPETPNTPITPKTPTYPEKLEINGNAKFTPSSLTPRTPTSSIDKPFYNPFTMDISLDTMNVPVTGNKLYENNDYTGPKLASLHNLTNYNTAPRGWNQSFTVYRPIKFEKPQEIMYSDF